MPNSILMNQYLSENKVWLQSTPRIAVLDGKLILIVDGESEYQSRLVVSYDNEFDPDSDKCTVSAQREYEDAPLWETPLPDTIQPSSKKNFRAQYFSKVGVDSIRDAVDDHHGELVLVIPQE